MDSRRYHSITLSARSTSAAGTSCPIAFAACRLMTSSNRVGCSTGMSAGLTPRKHLDDHSRPLAKDLDKGWAIARKRSRFCHFRPLMNCGEARFPDIRKKCAREDSEQRRCQKVKGLGARYLGRVDRGDDPFYFSDTKNGKFDTARARRTLQSLQVFSWSDRGIIERRHPTRARHYVDQQVLSFAVEFRREKTNTCGVAVRPRERRDQARADHVLSHCDERNRARELLVDARVVIRASKDCIGHGIDDRHGLFGEPIVVHAEAVRNDGEVLAFDEPR